MRLMFLRRATIFREFINYRFPPKACGFPLRVFRALHDGTEAVQSALPNSKTGIASSRDEGSLHLSALFSSIYDLSKDYKIEVVDDHSWQVSVGLANMQKDNAAQLLVSKGSNAEVVDHTPQNLEDLDFNDIEDMRVRGNLFYKLDRNSKEFEEYSFDFHRRKSSARNRDQKESKRKENPNSNLTCRLENVAKRKEDMRESKRKENTRGECNKIDQIKKMDCSSIGKRERTPTFNQLTAPYHEPFCLDIYVSKASVRACIIHRATSKVVAVAHSISKDLKFDLGSTKNAAACAAVGKVLAQRALADDIHNLVYTPRKGDKLEGKLHIVLQSVINNGVNVKVKIKQKKVRKPGFQHAAHEHC